MRVTSHAGRALDAALFLGPAALGVGVILVLAPTAVWDHVIGYRSTRGFFGLAGMVAEFGAFDVRFEIVAAVVVAVLVGVVLLLRMWRSPSAGAVAFIVLVTVVVLVVGFVEAVERFTKLDVRDRYSTAFTLVVAAGVAWLFHRLWREALPTAARLFLLVSVIFMTVVAFGSGYGSQYAYWFLPALVGTYVLLDDAWRRLLRIAWLIAALTYGIEYAFVPFLGAWAVAMFGSAGWMTDFADYLATPHHWVVFRLPLFVTYLVVIAAGIERLARESEPSAPG